MMLLELPVIKFTVHRGCVHLLNFKKSVDKDKHSSLF